MIAFPRALDKCTACRNGLGRGRCRPRERTGRGRPSARTGETTVVLNKEETHQRRLPSVDRRDVQRHLQRRKSQLPKTPALEHAARWWPTSSSAPPHRHIREDKGKGGQRRRRSTLLLMNRWFRRHSQRTTFTDAIDSATTTIALHNSDALCAVERTHHATHVGGVTPPVQLAVSHCVTGSTSDAAKLVAHTVDNIFVQRRSHTKARFAMHRRGGGGFQSFDCRELSQELKALIAPSESHCCELAASRILSLYCHACLNTAPSTSAACG